MLKGANFKKTKCSIYSICQQGNVSQFQKNSKNHPIWLCPSVDKIGNTENAGTSRNTHKKNNKTGKKAEKNRNYNINSIFYKLVRGNNYFTLESPSIINASFLLLFLYKIRLLSTSEKRHGK